MDLKKAKGFCGNCDSHSPSFNLGWCKYFSKNVLCSDSCTSWTEKKEIEVDEVNYYGNKYEA